MASKQQPSTSASTSQEYIVRVSKDVKKHHSILKFNPANNVDFGKAGKVTLERENNFKEFKQAYDIDAMPKFGAGSEFGREAREEARRKKYGIKSRVYHPEDQPWIMRLGNDMKTARKFKGIKEGGVLENTSYYIFTQCPDGAFEAFPVEEWFNFSPIARYKVLNSEEAEKEFEKREERVNYFNIMLRKRMKGDEGDDKDMDDDGKKVQKKKQKDLILTELDEWAILSDDDSGEGSDQSDTEKKAKKEKKGKKSKKTQKRQKSNRKNSDDEDMGDSDDLDEGKEVDYMTSSDSEDDNMYQDAAKVNNSKYDEKGVVEEDGLRKLIDSDEEEEEKNEEEDEDRKEDEDETGSKEGKAKKGSDSESSSSSDSDSDVEKDSHFPSPLFLKKSEDKPTKKDRQGDGGSGRSSTPTILGEEDKGKKRKALGDGDAAGSKKPRISTPTPSGGASSGGDGITEDAVRRYLMRKPMTTKELLIKFRNTGLSKEQRVTQLAQILKKLNPDTKKIKDQLYLSIKNPQ